MLNVAINFKCDCGNKTDVFLTKSEVTEKGELHLSGSIEKNSNGLFHCLQNSADGMNLVCVMCGKETKLIY